MVRENELLQMAVSKCKLFLKKERIPYKDVMRVYIDFLSDTILQQENYVNIRLVSHLGGEYFQAIVLFLSGVSNFILNETCPNDIVLALQTDDLVLYAGKRCKFLNRSFKDFGYGEKEFIFVKDNNGKTAIPVKSWHLIHPYDGEATCLDRRGVQKKKNIRSDFCVKVFGMKENEVPAIINTSSIMVISHQLADFLVANIIIEYAGQKVEFLDLFTVSYNDVYYHGNTGKNVPVLKLTNSVSQAREMFFDSKRHKISGIVVNDAKSAIKGELELADFFQSSRLRYVIVDFGVDYCFGERLLKKCVNAELLVFTKQFMQEKIPVEKLGILTIDNKIQNIRNFVIEKIMVSCEFKQKDFLELEQNVLWLKRNEKEYESLWQFLFSAFLLMKMLNNMVIPVSAFEKLRKESGGLDLTFMERLYKMEKNLQNNFDPVKSKSEQILYLLNKFYQSIANSCNKYIALKKELEGRNVFKKIAIIVPKGTFYYPLKKMLCTDTNRLKISTLKEFDTSQVYDEIIITGRMPFEGVGNLFIQNAPIIHILLYDFEYPWFEKLQGEFFRIERIFNEKMKLIKNEGVACNPEIDFQTPDVNQINEYDFEMEISSYLYNDSVRESEIVALLDKNSVLPKQEVVKYGITEDGQKVFFTKEYQAYSYNENEFDIKLLTVNDLFDGVYLLFSRDTNKKKDIVKEITNRLLASGEITEEVKESYRRVEEWKELLSQYLKKFSYSFDDLYREFKYNGYDRKPIAIRSWLEASSGVMGPREEEAFRVMGKVLCNSEFQANWQQYAIATDIARKYRTRILKTIWEVVLYRLSGNKVKDDLFNLVADHLEELVILVRIEKIVDFHRLMVSNLVNRPIEF